MTESLVWHFGTTVSSVPHFVGLRCDYITRDFDKVSCDICVKYLANKRSQILPLDRNMIDGPTIPGWRRYTQPKTGVLHITPMGPSDTMYHRYSTACRCEPVEVDVSGKIVMIHQAADGRPQTLPVAF